MKHSGNRRVVGFLRKWSIPLTALAILLLIAMNLGLAALEQTKGAYADMTPEKLYTLSDAMLTECEKLTEEVTVTFCDDPDRLLSGFSTRYVYIMAMQLANKLDNVKVETYNINLNPTALDRFRTTSASSFHSKNVIVSCGDRYRIYTAESFWLSDSEGESGNYWSFNGEYTMATAFFSVSSLSRPVAYFTYGHGEKLFVHEDDSENAALLPMSDSRYSAFYDLLLKEGLSVGYLNLAEVDAIPEDCALLIINAPSTDFPAGDIYSYYDIPETELLERYIQKGNGAVMIFKDPTVSLPNLAGFAEKWGIGFVDGSIVEDATQSIADAAGTPADRLHNQLIADYNQDQSTISYGVYSELATLDSAPKVVAPYSGSIRLTWRNHDISISGTDVAQGWYSEFLTSSENAKTYTADGHLLSGDEAVYTLSALTTRMWYDSYSLEYYYSYVYASAGTELITNTYLTNNSYANNDVFFALVRYISRVDSYADMNLGSSSFNSENVGGKRLWTCRLDTETHTDYEAGGEYPGFTSGSLVMWAIIIFVFPLVFVPVIGIVVCTRRRYL